MRFSGQKWLGRRSDTGAADSKLLMPLKRQEALKLLHLTDQAPPSDTGGLPTVCHSRESGNPNALHPFPRLPQGRTLVLMLKPTPQYSCGFSGTNDWKGASILGRANRMNPAESRPCIHRRPINPPGHRCLQTARCRPRPGSCRTAPRRFPGPPCRGWPGDARGPGGYRCFGFRSG